jgi:acetylornithine/N-succinyldiaminopimelate aminotransferase
MNNVLRKRFANAFMANYATPQVALVRGAGCTVWDADGTEYLDLLAGIAVSSLGHAHPAIVDAVSSQVARLAHTSNLYANEPAIALAERLITLFGVPDARVFLCNDGATANEAAIKVALRHFPNRRHFVAAERSFHGRTLGALALTGKPAIREPFGSAALAVSFVPYGDPEALATAVTADTAAVFLEPTLGESGVIPPPAGYLRRAKEVCDRSGALLVLDEVQGGIGRTGRWFAHQHDDVVPDVMTLAKGLAGGLPIGACLATGAAADALGPGDHGSTFGGNPVSCAAALAVLDTIERDGLLAAVDDVGGLLARGITAVEHPLVAGVRGRGLWLGIALTRDVSPAVESAARAAGFLVNAPVPDTIRLTPPLVLTAEEVGSFLRAWPHILAASDTSAGRSR